MFFLYSNTSVFQFDAENSLSDDISTRGVRKEALKEQNLNLENLKMSGLSLLPFKVMLLIVI